MYRTHSRGSIPLQWSAAQFWVDSLHQIQALYDSKTARVPIGMEENYKTEVSRKIGGLS
jgi:hypothetical protein